MTRTTLIGIVGLAGYAAINILLSALVALVWRLRPAPRADASAASRARQLVYLRGLPSAGAALLVLAVVVPAFAIFEPITAAERCGPLVASLAIVGLAQIAVAIGMAVAAAVRTEGAARAWLRSSTPLDLDPPAGVPAYAIDSSAPIVALVGVFSPRLVAARSVIAACTTDELTSIVAHERGHVRSRDNLKRWLMACAPDALRWSPVHDEIATAWHHAAEDAADDVAAGSDAGARVDLAALLVKIARLTPQPVWPAATVCPFIERDGLDRRVRRLVGMEVTTIARWPGAATAAACLGAAVLAAVSSPTVLHRTYEIVEALIAFGR
jgi:Zn-dependent protease with chaperone function